MARGRILLVGVAAALLVTSGTGAFSATVADRPVSVGVVEDDSALLGVEQSAKATNDTADLRVRIANRFADDLDVVTVTVDGVARDVGPIPPGGSANASFVGVPCDAVVGVGAAGPGAEVTLNRSVEC